MSGRYGITIDQYENMKLLQNNKCAICCEEFSSIPRSARYACIDHAHHNGSIRQLLCTSCNSGLGNLHESILLIEKAIAYLNNPPFKIQGK